MKVGAGVNETLLKDLEIAIFKIE
jgi:hypothetical protein